MALPWSTPRRNCSPNWKPSRRSWVSRWLRQPSRGCSAERWDALTSAADLFGDDPVLPGPFRGQQVFVCPLEEGKGIVLLGAVGGNSGADGERHGWNAVGLVGVRAVADFGEHALSYAARRIEVALRDDDAELVAAVADHDVRLAAVTLNEVREVTKHAVAHGMTVVVVDDLEVVEAEDDQGYSDLAAGGAAQLS